MNEIKNIKQYAQFKSQSFLKQCASSDEIYLIGPMPINSPPPFIQSPCIFVDGGLNHQEFRVEGLSLSIGDRDSTTEQIDILLPSEKDDSDLAIALHTIKELPLKTIHLLGFLGGREDHQLINYGELHHFLAEKTQVSAFFENHIIFYSKGHYHQNFHQTFSLLSFTHNKIKLQGAIKYERHEWSELKLLSSLCLSNIAYGKFELQTKAPLLLFKNL